jgi:purine-binding chemotaxis protein CheW
MTSEESNLAAAFSGTYLTFRLGREIFGFEARFLWEISTSVTFSPLPQTRSHLMGITHLHGKIVPVVDLPGLMGMPRLEPANSGGFIGVRPAGLDALGGFYVTQVLAFERFAPGDIQPPPAGGFNFLKGLAGVPPTQIKLLELDRLWAGIKPVSLAPSTQPVKGEVYV